jgi:biopolymer transport protein TolQ
MDSSSVQMATQQLASATLPIPHSPVSQSLSMWSLFWDADPIVKLVMFGLVCASVWSWTIIFQKVYKLQRLNAAADQFEESFWSGGALDDLYERIHSKVLDPLSAVFCSAMREWRRSASKVNRSTDRGTLEQRIDRVMQLTVNREMEHLERYMGFLASLGSNGVIVGLFGTVLGIMNTFQPMITQQSASLATVAPDIAEALFATAIGLVAAIPASIAYNKISSDLNRYANRLDAFATEFSAIVSRQLEEQA